MIRYEETPEHVFKLFKEIQTTYFPELRNAKISILYDLKKSSKGGKVQLGCIKRPNDLIRHFSKDEAIAIEGYDYIIILDKVCFENVSERDRERILRHELRHTYFDIDTDENPPTAGNDGQVGQTVGSEWFAATEQGPIHTDADEVAEPVQI